MAGIVPTLENVNQKIKHMQDDIVNCVTLLKQSTVDSPATQYLLENVHQSSKFISFMDSYNQSFKLTASSKRSLVQCAKEVYDDMISKGVEIPEVR